MHLVPPGLVARGLEVKPDTPLELVLEYLQGGKKAV